MNAERAITPIGANPSADAHQLSPEREAASAHARTPDEASATPPWKALWVLAAGLAIIVLDGTIVSVAMPTIIDSIGIRLTDAQWVTSLYNIVLAALLLPLGKLGDEKGRKTLFLVGIVVFMAGSGLAALSGAAAPLLASRTIQAIGAAMIDTVDRLGILPRPEPSDGLRCLGRRDVRCRSPGTLTGRRLH